ncbi:AAA family ATPase [Bradyrhizobium sp. Ash2021]|uniref:AAA family ATPase n=1 Tax=Bradyrhizobium sp. Ash2021 TaxID=2954771 RepID=UPI0028157716|nr:AAA family ATPase [Bradyrhizobium sp. Ash2021]WMT73426.1 AAA family ATPase [Bradyrhizobium sp. Ash2021]
MRGFIPPDYLLDGILQRRFCYSFTARTGTGKTAIMLRIAAHVALGRPLGSRNVERGKVLYFAGENPDDIRMRWIAMSAEMGFDVDTVEVYFIAGTFKILVLQKSQNGARSISRQTTKQAANAYRPRPKRANEVACEFIVG